MNKNLDIFDFGSQWHLSNYFFITVVNSANNMEGEDSISNEFNSAWWKYY